MDGSSNALATALHASERPTTYVDLMRARAAATPDALAFAFLGDGENVTRSITYAELDTRARAIAVELSATLSPGDRAMLLYPSGIDFIEAFLGCLYAGVIAVPMSPPLPARLRTAGERLAATLRRADPRLILTSSGSRYARAVERLLEDGTQVRALETDHVRSQNAARYRRPASLESGDLAFLQFTSGSTSVPKGVMVTHANLLANTAMMVSTFHVGPGDVFCHWLPLFHDMGLIGCVLAPIRVGAPVYFMSPTDFLQRPLNWLKAMSRYRGSVAPAPNFSYDLCVRRTTPEQRAELDLSSWTNALNGSEPVLDSTLARFADAFACTGFVPQSFRPCYGLAEATLLVAGTRRDETPTRTVVTRDSMAHGNVKHTERGAPDGICLPASGRVAADVVVCVVDAATGMPRADGELGEIWVAGPHVAAGYFRDEAATRAVFGATIPGRPERFLRTGDLGFLEADVLYVSGRSKDVIIQRGTNHHPHDLERTAEGVDGVPSGCVAAFGVALEGSELEQVVLLVEAERGTASADPSSRAALADRVREHVVGVHGVSVLDVSFVERGTIPRTSSGKTRRAAARDLYLASRGQGTSPLRSSNPGASVETSS